MVLFDFRLKIWIKNCGNEEIALKPAYLLHGNYYLCLDHFVDSNFTNSERKKLRKSAIPTVFNHGDIKVGEYSCDKEMENHNYQVKFSIVLWLQ